MLKRHASSVQLYIIKLFQLMFFNTANEESPNAFKHFRFRTCKNGSRQIRYIIHFESSGGFLKKKPLPPTVYKNDQTIKTKPSFHFIENKASYCLIWFWAPMAMYELLPKFNTDQVSDFPISQISSSAAIIPSEFLGEAVFAGGLPLSLPL